MQFIGLMRFWNLTSILLEKLSIKSRMMNFKVYTFLMGRIKMNLS